jgi:hypothetical protein
MAPMGSQSVLFKDFEGEAAVELHAGGSEEGTDAAGGAALLSDHLPEVGRIDAELKDRNLLALNFADGDVLGDVNQSFGYFFNKFPNGHPFHLSTPD